MFTKVQDVSERPEKDINPRMSNRYESRANGLDTLIDVYLTAADLEFFRQNKLLVIRDPTVEDGIIVVSPTPGINNGDGLDIELQGNITASLSMRSVSRFESGATPCVYSTAHQDGRGTSNEGTAVRLFSADEA
jgi:hypothetical protein